MQMLDGPALGAASGQADSLVLLLHGYGADGENLFPIAREWAREMPGTAFACPNAPDVCDQFAAGYQWFPIRAAEGISTKAFDRAELIKKPHAALDAFIDDRLARLGLDESRLVVAGFSQGAMMAMYAMPRRKRPCAGVIGWSGLLVGGAELAAGRGIVKMPVLAIHGDADEVVPPACLEGVREGFEAAGFDIETVLRPGLGHGIDQFGMMRGLSFAQEVLENTKQSRAAGG